MFFKVTTEIDEDRCVGCGLCVTVCPLQTISMQDGKAVVTGESSLNCGHCMAICPEEAVKVGAIDEQQSSFTTLGVDSGWLPYGEFDTSGLVRLMASRRSCRNFRDNSPVDRGLLEDLVKIGITAPSATNSQQWTFTIVPDRQAVKALGNRIREFFDRLNSMAENRLLRTFLKFVGKPELDRYYKDYYVAVKEGLGEWEATGRDRLFHGAPALIIIGSKPGASLPKEDSMLAAQNILLAAHSMGLGSCLIGMAVEAMRNDTGILRFLGIPDEEKVYVVIALGYSSEKYRTWAGRKKVVTRYFDTISL